MLAVLRGSDARYYHEDGLGSVRVLTDASGAVTDGYGYTAFGEALGWTGSDGQPYRFAGEEWEGASHLQYLRSRYYTSISGRFLSSDALPLDSHASVDHAYSYAANDPILFVDPLGMYPMLTLMMPAIIDSLLPSEPTVRAGSGRKDPVRCVYRQATGDLSCDAYGWYGHVPIVHVQAYSGYAGHLEYVGIPAAHWITYKGEDRLGFDSFVDKQILPNSSRPAFSLADGSGSSQESFINDGRYEDWQSLGPIPKGRWLASEVLTFRDSADSVRLRPDAETRARVQGYDRNPDSFLIHGGLIATNVALQVKRSASQGCIIVTNDAARKALAGVLRGAVGVVEVR